MFYVDRWFGIAADHCCKLNLKINRYVVIFTKQFLFPCSLINYRYNSYLIDREIIFTVYFLNYLQTRWLKCNDSLQTFQYLFNRRKTYSFDSLNAISVEGETIPHGQPPQQFHESLRSHFWYTIEEQDAPARSFRVVQRVDVQHFCFFVLKPGKVPLNFHFLFPFPIYSTSFVPVIYFTRSLLYSRHLGTF